MTDICNLIYRGTEKISPYLHFFPKWIDHQFRLERKGKRKKKKLQYTPSVSIEEASPFANY